jgi:hypothetical protein
MADKNEKTIESTGPLPSQTLSSHYTFTVANVPLSFPFLITPHPLPNIVIVVVNQHSAHSAHANSIINDKNTESNEASQLDQGSIVMFGKKSQTHVI